MDEEYLWKASVMDAVGSCNKTWLHELLEAMRKFSTHQLDFPFRVNTFTLQNGPRSRHSFDFITPLGLAASKGHTEIAEQLICAGARVDWPIRTGYTSLMLASAAGYKNTCNLLLDQGAAINVIKRGTYHGTALYYAACNGMSEIVHLLLARGGKLCSSQNEHTPLGLEIDVAVYNHHHRTIQVLLSHCENDNLQLQLGSIFSKSLEVNSEECAIAILRYCCYPLLRDTHTHFGMFRVIRYCSYFHKAAAYGMIKVMRLLIELNPYFMQEKWLVERDYPFAPSK